MGGPGYFDGPMEFGDPTIGMPGGEGLGGNFNTGPSGFVPNQFMGAQPPGAASFAPLGQPTNFVFGPDPIGQANMGFSGGGYGPGGPAGFDGGPGGFAGGPGGFAGGAGTRKKAKLSWEKSARENAVMSHQSPHFRPHEVVGRKSKNIYENIRKSTKN